MFGFLNELFSECCLFLVSEVRLAGDRRERGRSPRTYYASAPQPVFCLERKKKKKTFSSFHLDIDQLSSYLPLKKASLHGKINCYQ